VCVKNIHHGGLMQKWPRPLLLTRNAGLLKGEIVLENISLRKDVIRSALSRSAQGLPDYDISRGLIRELRIRIPWARVLSQSSPVLQVKRLRSQVAGCCAYGPV
jgi:hypothetical protein